MTGVAQLLETARERARLDDFGPDSFMDGLERLEASLQVSPAGEEARELVRAQIVDYLVNRLRVFEYAAAHPEVRDAKIERPLFVLGAPRTGTTLVSYLLDQDPARRSLLLWEAADSIPPPTADALRSDPRCVRLRDEQQAELAKNVVRPHVEFADGPTECLRVQGQEFKGLIWESRVPVVEYSTWLQDADMSSAYAYERLVLGILQSKAPGTWSLKMPSHALFVEYLVKEFPDARLVWTHRDPYKSLGSVLGLKTTNWARHAGDPHLDVLRSYYPEQIAEHLRRPARVREQIGHDRVYDLHYATMLEDPIAGMRRLYAWAGDELTPEAEAGMRGWLAENPQGRFGVHRYSLERFGLSKAELEPLYADYVATYDVAPEG